MKKVEKIEENIGSEEKILQAAKKLFTERGYAAVKTRDIAEEAGSNLALLNYYFRSKEKLFDLVMIENVEQFLHAIGSVVTKKHNSFDEKLEALVDSYITLLIEQPGIPLFVLNELNRNHHKMAEIFKEKGGAIKEVLMKDLANFNHGNRVSIVNPLHFLMNLMGIIVFPFAASPMLKKVGGFTDDKYKALMMERKALIPIWIKLMLTTDVPVNKEKNEK